MSEIIQSPFNKYMGKKNDDILQNYILPKLRIETKNCQRFIDLFCGTGRVFLNIHDCNEFIVNDIRRPMIDMWKCLQTYRKDYAALVEKYFDSKLNNHDDFERMSYEFNCDQTSVDNLAKFAVLIYRTYAGEVRFNKEGLFTSSYGINKYEFPKTSYSCALIKLKYNDITFTCSDFENIMGMVTHGDVVYGDCPYWPRNCRTRVFNGFTNRDHKRLADISRKASHQGASVWLSNFNNVDVWNTYNLLSRQFLYAGDHSPRTFNSIMYRYARKLKPKNKDSDTEELFWKVCPV